MTDRYTGKVVSVRDRFTVVTNMGSENGIVIGDKFLIVGLGEVIIDPDTQEELEQLEIVRGKAVVTHVQPKISTLQSCEYEKSSDIREIKKVTSRGSVAVVRLFGGGPEDNTTVTESIKPGEERLKELTRVQAGDRIIKL